MKRNIPLKLFLSIVLLISVVGCATTSGIKEAENSDAVAVITDIQVFDNKLMVTSNKAFTYTMYSTADPYKTTVEIPDMNAGSFNKKIISDNPGITEILPQQMESPRKAVIIEVVFPEPSKVVPVYNDNTLTLAIKQEAPVSRSEVPVVVSEVKEPVNIQQSPSESSVKSDSPAKAENSASMQKATEINSIELQKTSDAVKVMIKGNGAMTPNVFPIDERIVVDIPNVSMNADIPSATIAPLKSIRAGKHMDKVRLVLDLKEKTKYDVTSSGNTIIIALKRDDVSAQSSVSESAAPKSSNTASVSSEPAKLEEGKYAGKRLSLDFQDADIIPIFRLLADISGYNIVVNPGISGKITLKLNNVPWDQALDLLLRTFSLSKIVDGNIIRVVPTAVVAKELDDLAKAKKAGEEAGELRTKIFPVNYADLAKLKDAIDKAKIVSSRGSITLDERASSIIINDLDPNIEKVGALIMEIDQEYMQARQVMIEARIVEVTSDYTQNLGINWGFFWENPPTTGDHNFSVGAGRGTTFGTRDSGVMVNLPAASSFLNFGLGYINRAGTLALDLQLSAMEQRKKGKIVSSPRILTMNNESAKIKQGRTLSLPSTDKDGQTTLKDITVDISLDVKPRITPDGAVLLDVNIKKQELLALIPSGAGTGADKSDSEVKSIVLVNSGETIVMGGLFKNTQTNTKQEIPFLGKIPILGLLFQNNSDVNDTSELMVFITPRIVEFKTLK